MICAACTSSRDAASAAVMQASRPGLSAAMTQISAASRWREGTRATLTVRGSFRVAWCIRARSACAAIAAGVFASKYRSGIDAR